MHLHTFFRSAGSLVVLAGVTLLILNYELIDPLTLAQWVKDQGAWSVVVFILAYAVSAVFLLPGSVSTMVGGAVWGPLWGSLINLCGATLGAILSFLVARYLAGDWVQRKAGPRMRPLLEGVQHEGWRFVAFVRLVPIFPYFLVNYVLGLTPMRLREYIWSTAVFMFPSTFAFSYLGDAGRVAASGGVDSIQKLLWAGGIMAVLVFLPGMIHHWRVRRGLARHRDLDGPAQD